MHPADRLLTSQQGLATRAQLASCGIGRRPLERAVRQGVLRRVRRGLYARGALPARGRYLLSGGCVDPGYVAEVRAALLSLGGNAAADCRTAAVLWGFDLAVEPDDVEVVVGPQHSGVALAGVRSRRVVDADVTACRPVPGAPLAVLSPVATAVACATRLPLVEAVAAVDSALRSGRVTLDELRAAAAEHRGVPGARTLRNVLRLADPRCGSVLESLLRVLLTTAGVAPRRTQLVVCRADGTVIGRVDFAWPRAWLVVEADGRRWHDPEDARDRDRWRSNDLTALGWTVLRFTWADVVHRPDRVVDAVRRCLAAAA